MNEHLLIVLLGLLWTSMKYTGKEFTKRQLTMHQMLDGDKKEEINGSNNPCNNNVCPRELHYF